MHLQGLSERFVIMAYGLFGSFAKREGEIRVGFLSVVVGPDCVHPEDHFISVLVLVVVLVQPGGDDPRGKYEHEGD